MKEGWRKERWWWGWGRFSYSCSAGSALLERGRADKKEGDDGAETGSLSGAGDEGNEREQEERADRMEP